MGLNSLMANIGSNHTKKIVAYLENRVNHTDTIFSK